MNTVPSVNVRLWETGTESSVAASSWEELRAEIQRRFGDSKISLLGMDLATFLLQYPETTPAAVSSTGAFVYVVPARCPNPCGTSKAVPSPPPCATCQEPCPERPVPLLLSDPAIIAERETHVPSLPLTPSQSDPPDPTGSVFRSSSVCNVM